MNNANNTTEIRDNVIDRMYRQIERRLLTGESRDFVACLIDEAFEAGQINQRESRQLEGMFLG